MRRTTSRFLRLAAVLATIAQVVIAAAPAADPGNSRSAAAHVESGGTSTHYAHNEASCPACAVQQLLATGERRAAMAAVARPSIAEPARTAPAPAARRFIIAHPRAPPVVI